MNKLNIRAGVAHLSKKKSPCTKMFHSGSHFAESQNPFAERISDQEKQVLPVPRSLKTKRLKGKEHQIPKRTDHLGGSWRTKCLGGQVNQLSRRTKCQELDFQKHYAHRSSALGNRVLEIMIPIVLTQSNQRNLQTQKFDFWLLLQLTPQAHLQNPLTNAPRTDQISQVPKSLIVTQRLNILEN